MEATKFSGHETFTLRYGWLTKAVRFVEKDPQLFSRDDAMVTLGVGKNMVRSIKHWALSTNVLEEDSNVKDNRGRFLQATPLGATLFSEDGIDPYLENVSTLWLLHYSLVSQSDGPTTWFVGFNSFPRVEFTVEQLTAELVRIASESDTKASVDTIRRDVNCFIRTYMPMNRAKTVAVEDTLDCPFSELRLLHEVGDDGQLAFNRGDHPTLPNWVFAYALLDYWGRVGADVTTLSFAEIAYEPGSPGRVFKLTESAVSRHLHSLNGSTNGALSFDSTAGLSQVYWHRPIEPMELLPGRPAMAGRE